MAFPVAVGFFLQIVVNDIFIKTGLYTISIIPFFALLDIGLYFLLNYFLKGITKDDIKFLFSIINPRNIIKSAKSELTDSE